MTDDMIEPCKVVLIGESGVGKTSIISQYINLEFIENRPSTIGAMFSTKSVSFEDIQREIRFEIWDTAGQERFKALTAMFYKDAAAAIFVYDITREDSFMALEQYWIHQLKEKGPSNMVYAVAANKSDLYEKEKVEQKRGFELAQSINAIFKQTSAKNSSGINTLFIEIGKKYFEKIEQAEQGNDNNNVKSKKMVVSYEKDNGFDSRSNCCR